MAKRIFVLGSANMDLVFTLPRLARAGETLAGGDLALFPGGKGANQACAAALLGGRVSMIAQVGADAFGQHLLASLAHAGVDVSRVGTATRATGCACIYVLPNGENSIVISPGANASLTLDIALARLHDLQAGDILLAQLETPLATITAAFQHARERGVTTILDPAPAQPLPPALLQSTDYITPNQTEAAMLLNASQEVQDFHEAEKAADQLIALGVRAAIIKLGSVGSWITHGSTRGGVAAFAVSAVDTTAAGDVFNGAFAAALAEDRPLLEALRWANAAAALSVTRPGAQSSIPTRAEVEQWVAAR